MDIEEIIAQLIDMVQRLLPEDSPIRPYFHVDPFSEFLENFLIILAEDEVLHLKRMESDTSKQSLQPQDTHEEAQAHFIHFMNKLKDPDRDVLVARSELESAAQFLSQTLRAFQDYNLAQAYLNHIPPQTVCYLLCAQSFMLSAHFSDNYQESLHKTVIEDTRFAYYFGQATENFPDFPYVLTDDWEDSINFLIHETLLKMPPFQSVRLEEPPPVYTPASFPLHSHAAEGAVFECFAMLDSLSLQEAQKLLETKNEQGYTPLQIAVKNDALRVAAYLLELGANDGVKDEAGRNLASLAAIHNARSIFSYWNLFKRVNLSEPCDRGWTPLHYAAYFRRKNFVKILIDTRMNLSPKDNKGKTPLDYAILTETPYDIDNQYLADLLYYYQAKIGEPSSTIKYDNPDYENLKKLSIKELEDRAFMQMSNPQSTKGLSSSKSL